LDSTFSRTSSVGGKIDKPFEMNHNTGRISNENARSITNAINSTGHTLENGDLVTIKIVEGKAAEVELFNSEHMEGIMNPAKGSENRVFRYEGVTSHGENSLYSDVTNDVVKQAHLHSKRLESARMEAGKAGGEGENSNLVNGIDNIQQKPLVLQNRDKGKAYESELILELSPNFANMTTQITVKTIDDGKEE
jgi:hypothetical protein